MCFSYKQKKPADVVWWHSWNLILSQVILFLIWCTFADQWTILFLLNIRNRRLVRWAKEHSAITGELLPHDCHVGRPATCFTHEGQADWASAAHTVTLPYTNKYTPSTLIPLLVCSPNTCIPDFFPPLPLIWPTDGDSTETSNTQMHTNTHMFKTPRASSGKLQQELRMKGKKNERGRKWKRRCRKMWFFSMAAAEDKSCNSQVTVDECIFPSMHIHACMHWHNNLVEFYCTRWTFGKRVVSLRLSHYWNMELDRGGTFSGILVKGLIETHSEGEESCGFSGGPFIAKQTVSCGAWCVRGVL